LFFYEWEKGALCMLIDIFRTDDGSWETQLIDAHGIGCNAVTWAPAAIPGSLVQAQGANPTVNTVKKLVSAGCDNMIKIWGWK
jgi:protein transport protein SEC13